MDKLQKIEQLETAVNEIFVENMLFDENSPNAEIKRKILYEKTIAVLLDVVEFLLKEMKDSLKTKKKR